MNNTPLSDSEAQKLFASVSKNLDDPDKLNEILDAATVPDPDPAPEVGEEEVKQEVEKKEEEKQAPTQESEAQVPAAQPEATLSREELERLVQENKLLQHKHRSETNRTAALQRKLNELETRLASLSSTAAQPPAKAAPATEEGEDDDLAELKRTDPALYRIIKKREEAAAAQIASLQNTLTQELAPVKQAWQHQEVASEKARLAEMVPNIAEVVQSEAFHAFVGSASDGVKRLVMSKHADDVVAGLQVYSQWLQANGMVRQAPGQQEAPQAVPSPAASHLAGERERKLQQAVTVKSPAAPEKKELTAEELFAQSYKHFHKLHGN